MSQITEVFPVPLDPMQKMGGGIYTNDAEEVDSDNEDATVAVRDIVAERMAYNRWIWSCR